LKSDGNPRACVVGSTALRDYLINFARPYLHYGIAPHSIAAIDCAFEYLGRNMVLQQQLTQKIKWYTKAASTFLPYPAGATAIQSVIIPGNEAAREAAQILQQQGFDVRAILSPTVAQGSNV